MLQRQPLSAHTRRAYRIRVHQYADYLRSRVPDYGDPLQDPHTRDYATRDYKMFLKTRRRAKPRTVNLSLAAIDHFYEFLGLGKPTVRREELPQQAPSALRLENDELILSPLEAEDRPASAEKLADIIGERLPRVELTDLLVEVDTWVHFSEHFKHAAGGEARNADALLYLYASLTAQACNFGLAQMAQNADIPYHQLVWYTTWHIRENTLRGAFTAMVNYHHRLPLSQVWGGGFLSSSDGQHFPVSGMNI